MSILAATKMSRRENFNGPGHGPPLVPTHAYTELKVFNIGRIVVGGDDCNIFLASTLFKTTAKT